MGSSAGRDPAARFDSSARARLDDAYRAYWPVVFQYLHRRVQDAGRAEELTQEVFLSALASEPGSDRPMLAWLYTIARHRFVDEMRRAERRFDFVPLVEDDHEVGVLDRTAGFAQALDDAIRLLPSCQRVVVVLRLIGGCEFGEIAATVRAPEEACRARYRRGLTLMRARLAAYGYLNE